MACAVVDGLLCRPQRADFRKSYRIFQAYAWRTLLLLPSVLQCFSLITLIPLFLYSRAPRFQDPHLFSWIGNWRIVQCALIGAAVVLLFTGAPALQHEPVSWVAADPEQPKHEWTNQKRRARYYRSAGRYPASMVSGRIHSALGKRSEYRIHYYQRCSFDISCDRDSSGRAKTRA